MSKEPVRVNASVVPAWHCGASRSSTNRNEPNAWATPPVSVDVLDLDAALMRLAVFDPRKSQLAELRFFGGLSLEEAGEALGISLATAERDSQAPRAWLVKELRGEQPHDA